PDYEVELGVVIGRKGKYVNKSNALDYVAGYTVFNDISFRDWQSRGHPRFGLDWLHGKNMDSSTPVGPYLVTKDEIQDPYSLELILRVNGETRQKEKASGMVFGIEQIIEELSLGIKLLPGDLIATGTPAGVGHARQTYLKDGDLVEAEISGLGVLANRVIKEI
ncbi:MAG: fumarylacetoacetate hydrolase family protein, partial [Desulfurococcaceae archaeon]